MQTVELGTATRARRARRARLSALFAAFMLLGLGAAQAQVLSGNNDSILVDGFDPVGPNCANVAPGEVSRQVGGHWSLGGFYQGVAGLTDLLVTQSSGGTPWPGTQPGVGRTYFIGPDNYISMRFFTGARASGSFGDYRVSQSAYSPAASYLSISECPGDFRTGQLDDRCEMTLSGKGIVFWIISQSSPFRCVLEAQKSYYLNILLADPEDISNSSCPNELCGILMAPGY